MTINRFIEHINEDSYLSVGSVDDKKFRVNPIDEEDKPRKRK